MRRALLLLIAIILACNTSELVSDPQPSPVPSISGIVTVTVSPCAIPTVYPAPNFVLGVSTNCGNAQWTFPDPHAIDVDKDEWDCVWACTDDPRDPFPPHEVTYVFDYEPQIDPNAYLGPSYLPCCAFVPKKETTNAP